MSYIGISRLFVVVRSNEATKHRGVNDRAGDNRLQNFATAARSSSFVYLFLAFSSDCGVRYTERDDDTRRRYAAQPTII
jgi:hypothetical protein